MNKVMHYELSTKFGSSNAVLNKVPKFGSSNATKRKDKK